MFRKLYSVLLWQKVTSDLLEGCFCKASLKCVREVSRGADEFYRSCSRHCAEQWALETQGRLYLGRDLGEIWSVSS